MKNTTVMVDWKKMASESNPKSRYKITVSEVCTVESDMDDSYDEENILYTQIIDTLNIKKLVAFINLEPEEPKNV